MAEFWYTKQEPRWPHWFCQSRHALSITQPKAMGPGMPPVERGTLSTRTPPGGRPETQTRRALRNVTSATGVHGGCKGDLMFLSLGARLHAGRVPTVFDSGGACVLMRKWGPLGKSMAMGPSSGLLGNGALPRGGHSLVLGGTPAWHVPLCGECTPQLCMASSHSTVPRVLTTIHWIPSAKDRCRSQTHLQWKTSPSTPGKRGQVTPHASGRVLAKPRAASPGGKHLTEAVSSLLPQLSGGPARTPQGSAELRLGCKGKGSGPE